MPNPVALITGAPSGIGAAFAKKFASQGYDLIITGRRVEEINALAQSLRDQYKINVEVVIAELSDPTQQESLATKIKQLNSLAVLVNNAGYGQKNTFHEAAMEAAENMINVHNLATVKLTHAALPKMLANKQGAIINVSSILAMIPYRQNAMYCATKAFMNLFSESLRHELKGKGVRVQALCPGLTRSDFHKKIGIDIDTAYKDRGRFWQPMTAEAVVEKSLKALVKNKAVCIPGFFNKLAAIIFSLRSFLA
jgi:uncharacterized protein